MAELYAIVALKPLRAAAMPQTLRVRRRMISDNR
jgi:hypothetical protein